MASKSSCDNDTIPFGSYGGMSRMSKLCAKLMGLAFSLVSRGGVSLIPSGALNRGGSSVWDKANEMMSNGSDTAPRIIQQ